MSDENRDVNQEPIVPTPGVEKPTPPVEETQEPEGQEKATPQEAVSPEVQEPEQQVPYERFKSVIDEKNYWRQQAEALAKHPPTVQPQAQPTPQDPYAGMNADEEKFWRTTDDRARKIAEEVATKKEKQFQTQLQAQAQQVAQQNTINFRREHPDIKENSPEEIQIAQKMMQGFNSNDAYWSVMGPKGVQNAQSTAQTKVKEQMQAKKKANVEQSGVQTAGLPQTSKSFREDLAGEDFNVDID